MDEETYLKLLVKGKATVQMLGTVDLRKIRETKNGVLTEANAEWFKDDHFLTRNGGVFIYLPAFEHVDTFLEQARQARRYTAGWYFPGSVAALVYDYKKQEGTRRYVVKWAQSSFTINPLGRITPKFARQYGDYGHHLWDHLFSTAKERGIDEVEYVDKPREIKFSRPNTEMKWSHNVELFKKMAAAHGFTDIRETESRELRQLYLTARRQTV